MTIIKLETLYELGACDSQCKLFKEHFGEQVDLATVDVAKYASIFNLNWLARKLFKGAVWEEYIKEINAIYDEYINEINADHIKNRTLAFIKIYTRETGKAKP